MLSYWQKLMQAAQIVAVIVIQTVTMIHRLRRNLRKVQRMIKRISLKKVEDEQVWKLYTINAIESI